MIVALSGRRGVPRRDKQTTPTPAERFHSEFRAGWPRGIAPPGLPQIRTCPLGHTARHVTNSLRDGTLSGSQPVVGADTAPAVGRIDPREWSPTATPREPFPPDAGHRILPRSCSSVRQKRVRSLGARHLTCPSPSCSVEAQLRPPPKLDPVSIGARTRCRPGQRARPVGRRVTWRCGAGPSTVPARAPIAHHHRRSVSTRLPESRASLNWAVLPAATTTNRWRK